MIAALLVAAGLADFAALQDGILAAKRVLPESVEGVDVALYDSTDVYLYSKERYALPVHGRWKGYVIYRVPHGGEPTERELGRCGATPDYVVKAAPRSYPRLFSCSPWTIQGEIQRRRGSIYGTRDSYLATVVHEFAHAHEGRTEDDKIPILSAIKKKAGGSRRVIQEAYAIWWELKASRKLWPAHYERLRRDFVREGADDPHTLGAKIALELLDEP